MARVLAVANQKGGVAKITTAHLIGAAAAEARAPVEAGRTWCRVGWTG